MECPRRVHAAQFVQGVEQAGFDGADGAAQGGGNTLEGIFSVEPQVNDLPLFVGQGLHALPDED
jgi:hypothetical protein